MLSKSSNKKLEKASANPGFPLIFGHFMPLKTFKLVLIDLTWNPRCILNESTTMYNNKVHKRNFTINIEFKDIINLLIAFGKYKFNK